MEIELRCLDCPCRFTAAPDLPFTAVLERMTDEGPWVALADGETFEDMVCNALLLRGAIRCPDCGAPVLIQEESLARQATGLGAALGECAAWAKPAGVPRGI